MAHRGRLNVLVNVLGKSPADLFSEFEGKYDLSHLKGSGDVKYHKGFSADLRTSGGNVHVALAFNPSHLEVVNAGRRGLGARASGATRRCEGRARGAGSHPRRCGVRRSRRGDGNAAVVAGARVSTPAAHCTSSSTTKSASRPRRPNDARSTMYCSDVAKMLEAPIFHVNGDDPEAVRFRDAARA
jgi:2-oxoglutarate dehydrogenase E1 component